MGNISILFDSIVYINICSYSFDQLIFHINKRLSGTLSRYIHTHLCISTIVVLLGHFHTSSLSALKAISQHFFFLGSYVKTPN